MKTRRAILPPVVALAAALLCAGARAQKDDWQGKPHTQWTTKEAQKVLNDSPWAKTLARSGPMVSFSGVGGAEVPTPDKVFVLRLRSAMPVRQALLRLRQIKEKYDEMSDKKKAEFDEKNKALVECPACADNYVLSLIPPAAADTRSPTLDKMKLYVQLMDDRGQRRELVHFVPTKATGQEMVFFFPRLDEKGQPLLTPSSKRLIFTIDTTAIGLDATTHRFEFDVSKMVVDGRVVF